MYRNNKKAFGLTELLIFFAITAIIAAMFVPLDIKRRLHEKNMNTPVMKTVTNSTLVEDVDLTGDDGFTQDLLDELTSDDQKPLRRTLQDLAWQNDKTLNSLLYFAKGTDTSYQDNAIVLLRAACDLGNEGACKYFINECTVNNNCDVEDTEYDLNYYLNLTDSSNNAAKDYIIEMGTALYDNWSNMTDAVDSACCANGEVNLACSINGTPLCDVNLYGWGNNEYGIFGSESTAETNTSPTEGSVPSGVAFKMVKTSHKHTCALTYNKKIYCWGLNSSGQLGDGTTTDHLTPAIIDTSSYPDVKFKYVDVSGVVSLAISTDGTLYGWGYNTQGNLGTGDYGTYTTMTPISLSDDVAFTQVAVGGYHTCAVTEEGTIYCWGWNSYGEQGNDTQTTSSAPVLANSVSGKAYTKVAVGTYSTCALVDDGTAYCWGTGAYGLLGDNAETAVSTQTSDTKYSNYYSLTPVAVDMSNVPSGVTFVDIDMDNLTACALGSDGIAYCWGLGQSGQIGDGSEEDRYLPVPVTMPDDVIFTEVNCAGWSTCAIGTDGEAYCWGGNTYGDTGNGGSYSVPTQVTNDYGLKFFDIDSSKYSVITLTK